MLSVLYSAIVMRDVSGSGKVTERAGDFEPGQRGRELAGFMRERTKL